MQNPKLDGVPCGAQDAIMRKVLVLATALALLLAIPHVAAAQSPNGIVAPSGGVILRGPFTVVAVANDPDFRKWQLDLLVGGDPAQAHFLGVGETAQPSPALLQTVDSTLFPDGQHLLRLRVVREDQNYDEYLTSIIIANVGLPAARPAGGLGAISAQSRVTQLVALPVAATTATAVVTPTPQVPTPVAPAAPAVTLTAPAPSVETSALAQAAAAPARPILAPAIRPTTGRKWIEINISDQTLTAWQGGTPFLQTTVSTGKPGWRTLPGTFNIYLKYEEAHMVGDVVGDEYDTPDVPWTMYYSGDFAVHGAYWHDDFGTPVSHGCVNMRVDEAKALYEWAPLGTEVVVRPKKYAAILSRESSRPSLCAPR